MSSLDIQLSCHPCSTGPPGLTVAVVVEDVDGGLFWWVPAHPYERPEFHHADAMSLAVP